MSEKKAGRADLSERKQRWALARGVCLQGKDAGSDFFATPRSAIFGKKSQPKMVGLTGFEPAPFRSRSERSTKLSHNPMS